jgi:hypothetical protein
MKKLLYYLLIFIVFLVGNACGADYALLERHDEMDLNNYFKYHVYNAFYYFLSLIVVLWLLKYSRNRQKDFMLIGGMYGIASLFYDVLTVELVGGVLLITVLLKTYFKLFPEDRFWRKDRMQE